MYRFFILILLILILSRHAISQEYQEPDWIPPLPPPVEEFCSEEEQVSEPVIAYRISPGCGLADIKSVGAYRFGTEEVRREVMGFTSQEMVRRLVSGNFVFFNEISIELHKVLEPEAKLICTVDMMGKKVIDAKIQRQKVIDVNRTIPYDEPVDVTDNKLPDLGVFTYSRKVRYQTNTCPNDG
jgi:hypothetical protein